MAPAIAHFLLGAACVLTAAVPVVLRYEFDREHALWLIPLGGVWGLIPDAHHIAPVFVEPLYAFHSSLWVELFGFHYTLDRPAVRAQYEASVFGAITVFLIAIAGFWVAGRIRRVGPVARRPREHAVAILLATGLASGLATLALWIGVSVQDGFPLAASLVGSSSVLVGGLLTLLAGGTLGVLCAGLLEFSLSEPLRINPASTAGVGLAFGVGVWLLAVPVPLAVITGSNVPLLHFGSLAAVAGYGVVCGTVYALVRGAFSPRAPVRPGSTVRRPSHESN
ncbi:hypothetical protein [Halorubrum sp. SS7]|uniref:hypothetical protein n=3 Tax=unclassified Halorubrum TaxID=2642239 RepID=UPI0018EE7417|nr:hypothetical protein [Halorubrum sp. SS7]